METFVTFISFTPEGSKNLEATVDRAHLFREQVVACGGRVLTHLWLLGGAADAVCIFEAPSSQVAYRLQCEVEKSGNVKLQTCTAFDALTAAGLVGSGIDERSEVEPIL